MPRDGSGNYTVPIGTKGVPNATISSDAYNKNVDDVALDLNTARPIVSGGTGGTSPATALTNIGAEKNNQIVTNFDTHPWVSGSFSAGTGTGGAVDSDHTYSGIAYVTDADNIVVECRDRNDARDFVYLRRKIGGVWTSWGVDGSGLFARKDEYVAKAGDTMTGPLILPAPTVNTHATNKTYVDAQDAAVAAAALTEAGTKVAKVGDTMTGFLTLPESYPTLDGHAANKRYVDANYFTLADAKVSKAGDVMAGPLELPIAAPTINAHATNKAYVDTQDAQVAALANAKVAKTGDSMSGPLDINTGTATYQLAIGVGPFVAGAVAGLVSFAGGATQYGMSLRPAADDTIAIDFSNAAGVRNGSIGLAAASVAFNTSSDERLKEDLQSFDASRIVEQTEVYDFRWKATGERSYGILAQQAAEVFPQAVTHAERDDWWGIDYSKYVPVILQELKALRARVAELEGRATIDPKRR